MTFYCLFSFFLSLPPSHSLCVPLSRSVCCCWLYVFFRGLNAMRKSCRLSALFQCAYFVHEHFYRWLSWHINVICSFHWTECLWTMYILKSIWTDCLSLLLLLLLLFFLHCKGAHQFHLPVYWLMCTLFKWSHGNLFYFTQFIDISMSILAWRSNWWFILKWPTIENYIINFVNCEWITTWDEEKKSIVGYQHSNRQWRNECESHHVLQFHLVVIFRSRLFLFLSHIQLHWNPYNNGIPSNIIAIIGYKKTPISFLFRQHKRREKMRTKMIKRKCSWWKIRLKFEAYWIRAVWLHSLSSFFFFFAFAFTFTLLGVFRLWDRMHDVRTSAVLPPTAYEKQFQFYHRQRFKKHF